MTITRHLSLLSVAACLYSTTTPAQASGVQSGPSAGNAFAGGMFYDANNHLLYVSGQAYFTSFFSTTSTDSSQCFVASLDLNDWDFNDAAAVLTSSGTGTSSSTTTCQAIGFLAPSTFVVGGNSESGGLAFSGNEPMQGFALLVDRDDISSPLDTLALRPTASGRIEYPQFLVTVKSSNSIYSISLTSIDTTENTADYDQPNYMNQVKYGSSFDMTVRKLSLQQEEFLGVPTGPITLQDAWWHEFPVDDAGSGTPPRVFVGGVMVKNDRMLVVAGSTRGLGIAYGNAEGNDEDGFVTLLDLSSGELLALQSGQERNNVRIGTAQNDVVMGICDDPQDTNSFYIVGATAGVMDDSDAYSSQLLKAPSGSLQAFVSKLDIATLNVQWSRQWGARMSPDDSTSITGAFASGCSVVGNTLYVAGGVEDGAGMIWLNSILTNQGQDDLWVVSLNTNDASSNWMKQIGSDGSDELSRHGGVAADRDGNAILYGHTDGSLYRNRDSFEQGTDVFVIILDAAEGDHAPIGQPVAAPTDAPVEPTFAPEPLETLPPKDFNGVSQDNTTVKMLSFGIIALALLMCGVCILCIGRRHARKRAEAQKTSIFAYLQQFDVEDIDLRKSPPGGWHGTYLHKLAYGINKAGTNSSSGRLPDVEPSPHETAPLTHSSVVRDALFMDTNSAPSLGYRDDPELHGLDLGYDDLKPRSYEDRARNLKEVI